MKKILISGLLVAAVFLAGMMSGSSYVYAFGGFGPSISPDEGSGIAYQQTNPSESSYAMQGEVLGGPVVSQSEGRDIAFDKTLSKCPMYSANRDIFSGPVVSAEDRGAVRGTEDGVAILAMWCR